MFAIILTALAIVLTIFNYDSFMPAIHHMSQSLYENSVHRWHDPPSIGANTSNLHQVVQTYNSTAPHSLSGTAPTIPLKTETVQATASTNYEIEVNKADFDKCSKATINYNDITQTSIPAVILKSVKNEKKPVKSKSNTEKQSKSPSIINMTSVFIAVIITAIGFDYLCRHGRNKSTPTKALKEKSTEVKQFDFKHPQEMYPHIDTPTSNENSPLECLSTPPSDSILSLKEAPATPPGFVEPELIRVQLSNHVDGLTHSLSGEEDVYKAEPLTPANVLVDSTETPENKSNEVEPAIKRVRFANATPANLTVKADSIERRRHSISSDDSETNALNNDPFDVIHVSKVGKWAKYTKHFRHGETLRLYHHKETEVFDYSKMVLNSTYNDLKYGLTGLRIEQDIINLVNSVSQWFPFEQEDRETMKELQTIYRSFVKNKRALPEYIFKEDDRFYLIASLSYVLRTQAQTVLKLLDNIKKSEDFKTNLAESLARLQHTVENLNYYEYYRYRDFARPLLELLSTR